MSLGKGFLVVGLGALALIARLVVADETSPAPKEAGAAAEKDANPAPGASAAAGETIEQLIEQLDAADFGTREKAWGKTGSEGESGHCRPGEGRRQWRPGGLQPRDQRSGKC